MAHFWRDYTVLGPEVVRRHSATGEHIGARPREAEPPAEEHARQTHPQSPVGGQRSHAPARNARTREPEGHTPPDPITSQLGHLDYSPSEGAARRPSAEAERSAARELNLWIGRLTNNEQLAMAAAIQWMLQRDAHIAAGDHTMADVIFRYRGEPHDPPKHHGQPRPTTLHGYTTHWAHGGPHGGRSEPPALDMAPQGSSPHPGGHALGRESGTQNPQPPGGQGGQDRCTGHQHPCSPASHALEPPRQATQQRT